MLGVEQLFYDYQRVTNDDQAAATLVLADVMQRTKPDQPEYLTVKQAAKHLGVSAQTVYGLCKTGQLACRHIGTGRGAIRIAAKSLHQRERRLVI